MLPSVFRSSFQGLILLSDYRKDEIMINDEELKDLITDRLLYDPTVNSDYIDVSVEDGVISLTGEVESRDDRKWIEVLVRQVPEVTDVRNYLEIAPDDDHNDSEVHHPNH